MRCIAFEGMRLICERDLKVAEEKVDCGCRKLTDRARRNGLKYSRECMNQRRKMGLVLVLGFGSLEDEEGRRSGGLTKGKAWDLALVLFSTSIESRS